MDRFFSGLWADLAAGSSGLVPPLTGSGAIDGVMLLPSYILKTLSGGAYIFGS